MLNGNSTINTLTGVAQDPDTKLSSINIKQSAAKLTVDTLRVGLNGNNAIQRVEINKGDGNGSKQEFAVNKIQSLMSMALLIQHRISVINSKIM